MNSSTRSPGNSAAGRWTVDEQFNASYAVLGWRRVPVLSMGLPFWNALSTQERVALVGHEIAHGVNGDSTRSFIIGSALSSLDAWISLLRADPPPDAGLAGAVGYVITWLVSIPLALVQGALAHLLWFEKQKAEYFADYLSATLAGTRAVLALLAKSNLGEHFDDVLQRGVYSTSQSAAAALSLVRERLASLPERERDRLQRAATLEGARLDSTHPPTAHRIQFLKAHEVTEARLVGREAVMQEIDRELEQIAEKVGGRLIDRYAPA